MLTVIIIDDEVLVRVGLKSLIDWNINGYQLIGEAGNGEEGLRLIKEKNPDIVITDIKMPVKSGLEVIEEAKKDHFTAQFIVLSSYDEFNLVKEAMKLGAVDYLIKLELDSQLLLNTLTALKEEINRKKKKMKHDKVIKYNINNQENMRKEFFKKVIGKLINDKDEIKLIIDELGICLNEESLVCIVLKINNIYSLNKFNKGDMQLFEFSIINITEEIASDFFIAYAFMNNWGEIVLIISPDNEQIGEEYFSKVNEMAGILNRMLKQYFSVNISITISDCHKGFDNLSTAFFECCQALEYSFYSFDNKPIYYNEIANYQYTETNLNLDIFIKNFTEQLENMDSEGLKKILSDLINKFVNNKVQRKQAYDLCFQIIYQIKSTLQEELNNDLFDRNGDFYKSIDNIYNITEMVEWLSILKDKLLAIFKSYTDDEKNYIITQARKYIKKHFREELNLADLAGELNVSTGYLSTLFKEIVGIGFSEFLTKLKIEEAKKLLLNTNIKIYKISEMVGYNNPYYFSRVFKRTIGKTPSEYRLKKY